MEAPGGNVSLSIAYPRPPPWWKRAAKYAGVGAVIAVLAVVVIAVVAMRAVAGFLMEAAAGVRAASAPLVCWFWLAERQRAYEGRVNPATGQPYTSCEAAGAAVSDAEGGGRAPCPAGSGEGGPPGIYAYYASAQC